MNQESDVCTWPNADEICITPPSPIAPENYRGAATTSGKMIASWS
jgi:hypothetical protein